MSHGPEAPYSGPIAGEPSHARERVWSTRVISSRTSAAARAGVTMGTALAITISWSVNKSIFWAIIHGFLSWLYVIYYAIRY